MDVFFSWLQLNIRPEEMYTEEQMKAYKKRAHLMTTPDLDGPADLCAWLNRNQHRFGAEFSGFAPFVIQRLESGYDEGGRYFCGQFELVVKD